MKKYPFNQIVRKRPSKIVLVDLLEIRKLVYWVFEEVGACSFEFLKTFLKNFVMFVNEEVCEIVLITIGSTEYELSEAILLE